MKKLLPLIPLLVLTACSNPILSSSGNSDSSSSSEVTSSVASTSTSETTSSEISSSSSSSSLSSSTSSSSSSVPSSSSSSSSSSSIEVPPTPSELFDSFHELLGLKNSTLIDENYIEQKFIEGNVLTNHYFGKFAEQGDDGYCKYLDQGLYHFNFIEDGIEIDRCKTVNNDIDMCEFFYTTYDLKDFKTKWKKTTDDFVYTSTEKEISVLIAELDGQGVLAEGSDSFTSKLTLASDGKSAKYETTTISNDFGTFQMSFNVKDLGTTTHDSVTSYLATAPRLEITNEFPSEVKTAINSMFAMDINAPTGTSYAHDSYVSYNNDSVSQIFYEDFLAGDQVSNYRSYLESIGFILSDITDEKDDLKKLGYVRYYYEKVVGSETLFVELYFVPKIQLDTFEQTLYPNGILHLRFIRPNE
ncbi:MAG: hypothetical protein J6I84_06455 [Bacilli bacterium]|nr:hypothetical protein [Bacilli bacterium]